MLAACSGGADSVALVLLLEELQRASLLSVRVAHVHHGLRGSEADADAARVAALACDLGLPFHERRCDAAAAAAERRRGMEEAARHVRREALEDMRLEAGCDVIALAHSADDQAETVLLRLLRGSGAEGLSAMPARAGRLARPLLTIRRADLRALAHERGASWSSDPTNWSPSSARSLVRELLARLEESLDERVVERACETADQLRDESEWLDAQAAALLEGRVASLRGSESTPLLRVTDASSIGAAHPAIRRRAVRRLLRDLRPGEPPPSADSVRRAERLFCGARAPISALLPGLVLRRAGADVLAGPEIMPPVPMVPLPLLPGESVAWAGGIVRLSDSPALDAAASSVRLDADLVREGLVVRARRPGDALPRARGRRRLGEILAAGGIPAAWRDAHPLVCLGPGAATIVWVAGLEADPRFLAKPASQRVVELSWTPAAASTGAPE